VTYNEPWFTTTRNFWVGPGDQVWPDQKIKYVRHLVLFEGTTSSLVTFYHFIDTQVITNFIFPDLNSRQSICMLLVFTHTPYLPFCFGKQGAQTLVFQ
jgi:hypothetical protein